MKSSANIAVKEIDRRILLIFVLLTAVGVYLVASSSSFFSAARFSDPYFLIKRHLLRVLIAVLALAAAVRIDYRLYRRPAAAALILAVGMLLSLFIIGHPIRGSAKWLYIKYLHATLQPSDPARLALIMFLASWIAKKGRDFTDFKHGFMPAAAAVAVVAALMAAQPNFGTAAATVFIALVVMYAGGARIKHLFFFLVFLATPVAVKLLSEDYARARIHAFFSKSEGLREINWQVYQSLIGLGSGGFIGTGFGESMQKLNWLPDSHTDFIFSILGEEAGLVGTFFVSALFLLLALRALKISKQCGDVFGEMLSVGIGSAIFLYSSLNMAVATRLLPVTGLPLPFISYGGSALVINAISIGILLNIAGKQKSYVKRNRLSKVRRSCSAAS